MEQLADVTIDRVKTGDVYADELFLITPTGTVGPMGPAGLKSGPLHQLQVTILSYRARIRAGNAQWEPTVGDDAISYPRDRQLSGSSPPDRNIWEKRPEDFPAWLVLSTRLLAALLTLAFIVLAVKYRWQ